MTQKKLLFLLPVALLFAVLPLLAQTKKGKQNSVSEPFRIIGYYSFKAALTVNAGGKDSSGYQIPFDKLTHINLWFVNPDSLGNFSQNFSGLESFIKTAHKHQIKVLFSIGGGSRQSQYHTLLQDKHRSLLVQKLVEITRLYNLDGIDVDLEGSDIDENYEKFVTELSTALKAHNKLITAAIAVYYKDQLSDKALAQYDFVNIMSYDRTGPWNPDKPGPHSTYEHAVEDLTYFGKERAIPKQKMTLGLPFYGYGYGKGLTATSMDFKQIQESFPTSELANEWAMPDGRTVYYNGIEVIKQKTKLAQQKASGIMIWQLTGDASGPFSLLDAVYNTVHQKK